MNKSKQVGGDHYQFPIQPITYITENNLGYREGNVIKYTTRHHLKGGKQDIETAIHYLEMILEGYNEREESQEGVCTTRCDEETEECRHESHCNIWNAFDYGAQGVQPSLSSTGREMRPDRESSLEKYIDSLSRAYLYYSESSSS